MEGVEPVPQLEGVEHSLLGEELVLLEGVGHILLEDIHIVVVEDRLGMVVVGSLAVGTEEEDNDTEGEELVLLGSREEVAD